MIYLDSWVWIEYATGGQDEDAAGGALERARAEGSAVSAIGLTEVEYVLTRTIGRDDAYAVTSAIEELPSVDVVPVTVEVAKLAARLRTKYYERRERELSYADAIHAATAIVLGCSAVHTGDADFAELEEIDAIVYGE